MHWIQISVVVSPEYIEPVSHLFATHCCGGIAIEQPGGYNPDEGESPPQDAPLKVIGYIHDDKGAKETLAKISAVLRLIATISSIGDLEIRQVDSKDWELEPFEALRIGKKLFIAPPNKTLTNLRGDEIIVRIQPGIAFGTGQHPTTRMMIEELESTNLNGSSILDVGTGSGILAIIAAKLGAVKCVGFDTDAQAVSQANKNAKLASVQRKCIFIKGTLPHTQAGCSVFDIGLCNISALMVSDLAPYLSYSVRNGGKILISGILTQDTNKVVNVFANINCTVKKVRTYQDWVFMCVINKK